MHITVKAAVLAALTVGSLAAVDANAAISDPTTDTSQLLFFVNDTSNNTTYTEVLTQTIGATGTVFSNADATTITTSNGLVNTILGKANFSYDATAATGNANLASFISTAQAAGQSLQWGIVATATTGATPNKASGNLMVTTSTDYDAGTKTAPSVTGVTTPNVGIWAGGTGLGGDISVLNLGSFDAYNGTSNGIIGTPSSDSANLGYASGVKLAGLAFGSSAQLFGLTGGGTSGSNATVYNLGTVSFDGSTLKFTGNGSAAVPLPAAVWLLGSGLLGLAGVSRRRRITPVEVA